MNCFMDKTFIGFYFKFPHYYYSILTISPKQQFKFISHQKQLNLTEYLSKKVCIYSAVPMAEVDFYKQNATQQTSTHLNKIAQQKLSSFYLGYEQGQEVFLMAKVSETYFQEQAIRHGQALSLKCHYEIDIFALWHMIYWQCLKHDYLAFIILWIYTLEQGYYLLLGRGENLWTYHFVRCITEIKSWLSTLNWPYPSFYCALNQSICILIPEITPLFSTTHFNEWTLSAALAIRGAYAAI